MLSKEEVDAEKATMRAIDARPIKKVAEAKQRKRKRLQVLRLAPLPWPSLCRLRCPQAPEFDVPWRPGALAAVCLAFIPSNCVSKPWSHWHDMTLAYERQHSCTFCQVSLCMAALSTWVRVATCCAPRMCFANPACVAQTRLAAAKSKAEAVVGQEDLSERGKAREIEKLYAKARAGKGAKKAKPTRVQKRHAKGPMLDGRMRSDKRQVRLLLLQHSTAQQRKARVCFARGASAPAGATS